MIQWLDEFYKDPELKRTIVSSFLPVFDGYLREATGGFVPSTFVQSVVENYVERHLGSSRAQLQEVLSADEDDDPVTRLSKRFAEWEEKRPEKVARNELVRSANAAKVEQMRTRGVTRKVWRSSGGSCPYCTGLNGRTISIEEAFFTPDDEYSPEGAEGPLTFTSKIGHPPVHQGCDCSIEASTETEQIVYDPALRPDDEVAGRMWDDLVAEADAMREAGLNVQWSGVLRLEDRQGWVGHYHSKDRSISLNPILFEPGNEGIRYHATVHELFHSVSRGGAGSPGRGWEEGVVDMLTQVHGPSIRARMGITEAAEQAAQLEARTGAYKPYRDGLEQLRTLAGGIDQREFYETLASLPGYERAPYIIRTLGVDEATVRTISDKFLAPSIGG